MEGFVQVKVKQEVINTLKRKIKEADDFIKNMKTQPYGEWSNEKWFFGLFTKRVWTPGTPDSIDFVRVNQRWYTVVECDSYAFPKHEFASDTVLNVLVEHHKHYYQAKEIVELSKQNSVISLSETLVSVYNKYDK